MWKHFHSLYRRFHDGKRSYTWVKNALQAHGLVDKGTRRGAHLKRRARVPFADIMLHQDSSSHEWVPRKIWDLIIIIDDATNEHYSMFFVEEEGIAGSFRGIKDVIENCGVFSSLYTNRGSHYWYTLKAGGKVDKAKRTQFGRAMRQLRIEMIPAYSPQARGHCERAFGTHQGRLVKELALNGITEMSEANRYLKDVYMPALKSLWLPLLSRKIYLFPGSAPLYQISCASTMNSGLETTTVCDLKARFCRYPRISIAVTM